MKRAMWTIKNSKGESIGRVEAANDAEALGKSFGHDKATAEFDSVQEDREPKWTPAMVEEEILRGNWDTGNGDPTP